MSVDTEMDAKDELERILKLDIPAGARFRRINLPRGWPEETVTVTGVSVYDSATVLHMQGTLSHARYQTFAKNFDSLYERVD